MLVVFLTLNTGGTISSVTFNGMALTQSGSNVTESGGGQFQQVWYIYGQSGTHNLVITFSGVSLISTESSFTGVAQAAPEAAGTNTGSNTVSTSLVTTVSGDWIIGMCKSYGASGTTYSVWSVRNSDTGGAGFFSLDSTASVGAAGTYTPTCNHSGDTLALTAMAVQPFGSGSGTSTAAIAGYLPSEDEDLFILGIFLFLFSVPFWERIFTDV